MNIVSFVIGLIVGWIGEWLIDYLFWRRKNGSSQEEIRLANALAAAETRNQELESKIREMSQGWREKLGLLETENADLRSKIESSVRSPQLIVKHPEHLERIHGIGKVFAARLNEAGVHTFDELGKLEAGKLREITGVKDWQDVDTEAWVLEARKIASEMKMG